MFDLTGPRFEPQTSHFRDERATDSRGRLIFLVFHCYYHSLAMNNASDYDDLNSSSLISTFFSVFGLHRVLNWTKLSPIFAKGIFSPSHDSSDSNDCLRFQYPWDNESGKTLERRLKSSFRTQWCLGPQPNLNVSKTKKKKVPSSTKITERKSLKDFLKYCTINRSAFRTKPRKTKFRI